MACRQRCGGCRGGASRANRMEVELRDRIDAAAKASGMDPLSVYQGVGRRPMTLISVEFSPVNSGGAMVQLRKDQP
jgi:hypothetical protein